MSANSSSVRMAGPHGPDQISKVILEYAARITAEQDSDALLRLNADLARDLVGADRCSIWLLDKGTGELWTTVAHGVDTIRIPAGQGLVGACMKRNELIIVNDPHKDSQFFHQMDASTGYETKNVLAIPLRVAEGRIIGVLQALNKPDGFDASDAHLIGLAATYTVTTLETKYLREEAEKAKLIYRELEIAHDVQRKLLPPSEQQLGDVEFAAFCRPARAVGGDYYDVVAMPDGSIAFTLGDVSGKGIAAAVLMAGLQASLRTQMQHINEPLSNLLAGFNTAIYGWSMVGHYSTLFCAVLDPRRRTLTYVNAGHLPPLRIGKAAPTHCEKLQVGGVPIGLMEEAEYQQGEIELAEGDMIIAYSDGLSEAQNPAGDMWEEINIENTVLAAYDQSSKAILSTLIEAVDSFTGGAEQGDDMTAIVIRIH